LVFFIVVSGYDFEENKPYEKISLNTWNDVLLPGLTEPVKVWYSEKGKPSIGNFTSIIKHVDPHCIYLNGIYSPHFIVFPLLVAKYRFRDLKVVVCPRGMLQDAALALKSNKKRFYLSAVKAAGLFSKVYWHATSAKEVNEIERVFPMQKGFTITSNIPKKPFKNISLPIKKPGELRIIFLALISEMKNLFLLLSVLKTMPGHYFFGYLWSGKEQTILGTM
jgi:hypothetical protein